MNNATRCVGLDVGGTAIKAGAVSETGQILFRESLPLGDSQSLESLLSAMVSLARKAGVEDQLGVGIAGLVNREAGSVEISPNLPDIEGVELRKLLAAHLGFEEHQVSLENDANAAAFGEVVMGAARDIENSLMITLGTGIGGSLVQEGRLVRGEGGLAGELGHLVVDPSGILCGCGSRGCAETLASGSAAIRRAREAGLPHSAPGDVARLCEEARAGQTQCLDLLHAIGRDLGHTLAAAVTLLDIRTIVVGGGFGAALDLLEPGIESGIEERSFRCASRKITLLPAALGADAGWIGAGRLARISKERTRD